MVPRKKATIRNNTAIDDGIMDGQDASYDNAHANTRHQDNTPEEMQRDADPEAETTSTVGNKEQRHRGKCPTATSGPRKGSRIHQDSRTSRNYASSRNTSRNAGRVRAQQRKHETTRSTHSGIPEESRNTRRRIKGAGETPILHMPQV